MILSVVVCLKYIQLEMNKFAISSPLQSYFLLSNVQQQELVNVMMHLYLLLSYKGRHHWIVITKKWIILQQEILLLFPKETHIYYLNIQTTLNYLRFHAQKIIRNFLLSHQIQHHNKDGNRRNIPIDKSPVYSPVWRILRELFLYHWIFYYPSWKGSDQ